MFFQDFNSDSDSDSDSSNDDYDDDLDSFEIELLNKQKKENYNEEESSYYYNKYFYKYFKFSCMSEYEIFLIPRKNIIRLSNEDILMSKDWMKTFLECVSNIKKTGKEEDYILCYCFQKNSFLYYRNEEESVLSHFIFDDLEEEKNKK